MSASVIDPSLIIPRDGGIVWLATTASCGHLCMYIETTSSTWYLTNPLSWFYGVEVNSTTMFHFVYSGASKTVLDRCPDSVHTYYKVAHFVTASQLTTLYENMDYLLTRKHSILYQEMVKGCDLNQEHNCTSALIAVMTQAGIQPDTNFIHTCFGYQAPEAISSSYNAIIKFLDRLTGKVTHSYNRASTTVSLVKVAAVVLTVATIYSLVTSSSTDEHANNL